MLEKHNINGIPTEELTDMLCQRAKIFSVIGARPSDIFKNLVSICVNTQSNTSLRKVISRSGTRVWLKSENTTLDKYKKRGFILTMENMSQGTKHILNSKSSNSIEKRLLKLNSSGDIHTSSLIKVNIIIGDR